MEKDVIISLKGKQNNDEENTIELVTQGKYSYENNNYCVTYQETELTGLEGTTTTLKVEDGRVTLTRTGSSNTIMVFEKGCKHFSCYETSFGPLVIGVSSDDVNIDVDESGGEISASYSLEVNNSYASNNDFRVLIKECNH